MRLALTVATVAAGVWLAACGGGGSQRSATTRPATTPSTHAPAPATSAERPVDSCSLLSRRDLARALGTRSPTRHPNASGCTYRAGSRILALTRPVAYSAQQRRSFEQQALIPRAERRVTRIGDYAVLRTYYTPARAAHRGRQTGISLIKRGVFLQLLMTDTSTTSSSLTGTVIRLGRAAARRL